MTRTPDLTMLLNMLSPDDLVGDDAINFRLAFIDALDKDPTIGFELAEARAFEAALWESIRMEVGE
jgi:hypothetical protein